MVQSLIQNARLDLDLPGNIIKTFNNTYSQLNDFQIAKDDKKKQQIEDDLLNQTKFLKQTALDLVKQGVPYKNLESILSKSDRTLMEELKAGYGEKQKLINNELQENAWQQTVLKYPELSLNREEFNKRGNAYITELLRKENKVDWSALAGTETQPPQPIGQPTSAEIQTGAINDLPQQPIAPTSTTAQPNI